MTGTTKKRISPLSKGSGGLCIALAKGGPIVWLSALVMGLANLISGQIIKGILFFLSEVGFALFMLSDGGGLYLISRLPSLGEKTQEKVWNSDKGIFEYTEGDRSQLILLYGICAVCTCILFVLLWRKSIISGAAALKIKRKGLYPKSFLEDTKSLLDERLPSLLMTPPTVALLLFTVLPLIYMMSMAFTDFSSEGDRLVLFDWVGLSNFKTLFNSKSLVGRQFWSVLGWTVTWAVFATSLNFLFGTLVAMLVNRPTLKLKGLWRTVLATTIAVPQFVSLMVVRSMLQPEGIINRMLLDFGFVEERLPFLTDALWARALVIIVNLWIGIPYTILQVTGVLNNIPKEQYDAAKVDGCNSFKTFTHVTVPYMLFVLTPYLITQFTGNINNFNIIYLLTRGEPIAVGDTAGATDLLITWLYKLSVDQQKYNLAAVIGILTFIILSVVALLTYRKTPSYKNEEGFR